MYSFDPTEEQQMLIDTIVRYASGNLRPAAHDADEEASLPANLIQKGWELGILQASIPEAYGGFGDHSTLTGVLAAEELAWGDLAGAMAVLLPGLFAIPILMAGSDSQKQTYLPSIAEGDWMPFTAALIEPYYDFDPNDLRTTAKFEDGEYVLSGEKTYVPIAGEAQAMILYAKLDGITQGFVIEGKPEGMVIGERVKLMGVNALPMYSVRFQDVHVPQIQRLGGAEGHEFAPLLAAMQTTTAAMAVGVSRAALEYSRDYAKDREVFGVKVAQKQVIAFMLAEMATEIEAMRLLTWEAAWMLDTGKPEAFNQAYLAHTGAVDMAMMVTDRAVQILGGHGYIREHPVELWMRNGRGFATFTGLAIS